MAKRSKEYMEVGKYTAQVLVPSKLVLLNKQGFVVGERQGVLKIQPAHTKQIRAAGEREMQQSAILPTECKDSSQTPSQTCPNRGKKIKSPLSAVIKYLLSHCTARICL